VRRKDSLPGGRLVGSSFDGWGGVHKPHIGLGIACQVLTFSAFFAAFKEALWHADTGNVLGKDLTPRSLPERTGTSWPCQV
jgi:hypothetical protein